MLYHIYIALKLWIILLIELYIPLSWFWLTHYICSRCWSSHLLPPEPGLSWNTYLKQISQVKVNVKKKGMFGFSIH